MLILLQVGDHKYNNLSRSLIQWDGQHYLSIARDGYEKFPCSYNQNYICGNIGWFPLYPIMGTVLSFLPVSINWVMILISWISLWIALILIFKLVKEKYNETAASFSIVALLLFPGSFYFLTGFPYALYLLLSVSVFYCLDNKKFLPLIFLTGLLTVTYPSGIIIGLPVLYYLITNIKKMSSNEKKKIVFSLISIGLALFLYYSYYWFRFDDFFLYNHFQAQSYYAHDISFPLLVIYKTLTTCSLSDPVWLMLTFTILTAAVFYSKKIPTSWQIFMFGILLFTPTLGTTDCYYRHIVVAFPLYIMIGIGINNRRRKYLFGVYALAAILLTLLIYLPQYKTGNLM